MLNAPISNQDFSGKKKYYALVSVIILGVFLRFYHLGHKSMWQDESASLWSIQASTYGNAIERRDITEAINPPASTILYHSFARIFNNFDLNFLRILSAIFGSLTIVIVY